MISIYFYSSSISLPKSEEDPIKFEDNIFKNGTSQNLKLILRSLTKEEQENMKLLDNFVNGLNPSKALVLDKKDWPPLSDLYIYISRFDTEKYIIEDFLKNINAFIYMVHSYSDAINQSDKETKDLINLMKKKLNNLKNKTILKNLNQGILASCNDLKTAHTAININLKFNKGGKIEDLDLNMRNYENILMIFGLKILEIDVNQIDKSRLIGDLGFKIFKGLKINKNANIDDKNIKNYIQDNYNAKDLSGQGEEEEDEGEVLLKAKSKKTISVKSKKTISVGKGELIDFKDQIAENEEVDFHLEINPLTSNEKEDIKLLEDFMSKLDDSFFNPMEKLDQKAIEQSRQEESLNITALYFYFLRFNTDQYIIEKAKDLLDNFLYFLFRLKDSNIKINEIEPLINFIESRLDNLKDKTILNQDKEEQKSYIEKFSALRNNNQKISMNMNLSLGKNMQELKFGEDMFLIAKILDINLNEIDLKAFQENPKIREFVGKPINWKINGKSIKEHLKFKKKNRANSSKKSKLKPNLITATNPVLESATNPAIESEAAQLITATSPVLESETEQPMQESAKKYWIGGVVIFLVSTTLYIFSEDIADMI